MHISFSARSGATAAPPPPPFPSLHPDPFFTLLRQTFKLTLIPKLWPCCSRLNVRHCICGTWPDKRDFVAKSTSGSRWESGCDELFPPPSPSRAPPPSPPAKTCVLIPHQWVFARNKIRNADKRLEGVWKIKTTVRFQSLVCRFSTAKLEHLEKNVPRCYY